MFWFIGFIGAAAMIAIVVLWLMRNLPTAKEVFDLLSAEPLARYPYTNEHLKRVSVLGHPPRHFVGNDRMKVAYWRTRRPDGVNVETIAFFHAKKTGDVRITFLDSRFQTWTHDGAAGKPLSPSEHQYLTRTLEMVRNFAP